MRFFVLDSRSLDPDQLTWLREQLQESGTAWKICYLHHPLYTSGRYRAGARALRTVLEPILVEGDVDVVLSGHEHLYERLQPQHGISYFTSGGAGSLRRGDLAPSTVHAKGFDTDYHFMLMEVSGNELFFQAISRTGETVDAGVISQAGHLGDALARRHNQITDACQQSRWHAPSACVTQSPRGQRRPQVRNWPSGPVAGEI